ncbi:MAG: DNA topoisomerase, partial [Myxococcota bacterium]
AAQRLYENGYITYMRTDSTTLSEAALSAARKQIAERYGKDYVPAAPRTYKKKVKNAQEAHEAIRPAGDDWKLPEQVAREVGIDEAKVYELVWKRTLASQMEDARGQRVSLRIEAMVDFEGKPTKGTFGTSGLTITFPGFLRAYVEGSDDPDAELENKEKRLPPMEEGQSLFPGSFAPGGHETQPPARFTEASLVRSLEEMGVGRPSTYAAIIKTIVDRGYVWKKGSALVPSFTAFVVVSLLEQYFTHLVDYAFTARMEDALDEIANGHRDSIPWLKAFYFGSEEPEAANDTGGEAKGLVKIIQENLEAIDARAINTLRIGADPEGEDIVVRHGKYGPYLLRGDDKASIPEDMPPDELTVAKAVEMLSAPKDREIGVDPESGETIFYKDGRYGPYVQLGTGGDDKEKPKTSSLLKSMSAETLTLEDALKLLSLPRTVGNDPEGVEIQAINGRYGPYIKRGKDSRSLEKEDDLFSVTVEQALEILSKPAQRRRRAAPEPLKELGKDPVSGETITLRKGRFGPY